MNNINLTAQKLAARWACHRTTAARIMKAYGKNGWKSHSGRGGIRRYPIGQVEEVERRLQRLGKPSDEN